MTPADLATVRVAAGLDPTWDRGAVRTHVLLAAAGLAAATWAAVPHGFRPILGMAAFAVPVADWAWRYRRRADCTAAQNQEWRDALAVLWYGVPLTMLVLWSPAAGLSLLTTAGLIVFMLGLVLFGSAVGERRMRPLLGWAVAFMAGGLIAPLHLVPPLAVVALAIAVGATLSGLWIAVLQRADGE